ncbi:hypothetical protein Dda_3375 [Drechslerella dactyloides]|uniref:CwfJ domain protein n=1 Tax=Drechslerella dactyloides TaxID=74499 RepID=A0AAD6J2U0_DREDA|nr:hypothetical protein Dda_3375 [Drechslerella dactyloides]
MASSKQHSVIVVGNPGGAFPAILSKLSTLHKKNSFSFAIVIGNLFPSPESLSDTENDSIASLLRGNIEVALPVYFTLGTHPFPDSIQDKIDRDAGEVCENLFFLGKRATLTTSDGVKIVALGGRLDASLSGASKESKFPFYSEQDASILHGANSADLLITGEWPEGVATGSKVSIADESREMQKGGNRAVQKLSQTLRPRYHFVSGGGGFYEREPYRNEVREKDGVNATELVTRFIAVADYGNAAKAKWMYAFKLDLSQPATIVPPNCTSSPYRPLQKRAPLPSQANFFWGDQSNDHGHGHHRSKRPRHDPRPPPPGPENCFFCLSNPNIQKHLITSIGSTAYLTTAKGPLTTPLVNAEVPFPGHILVIPLEHTPTLQGIPDEETFESTVGEMERYRRAIGKLYGSLGCGTVTFEVVRRMGIHPHWQVVPVGKQYLKRMKSTFEEMAKEEEALGPIEEREAAEREEGDFFRIWIEDEEGETTSLVAKLKERVRFDLQFGRKVLAKVFGLEDRMNWKDCAQEADEEARDAEAFKKAFKEFDFSLEE